MTWQDALSWEAQRQHLQWHTTGQTGPGQLLLKGQDLSNALLEGGYLHKATLEACDLTQAHLRGTGMQDAILTSCHGTGVALDMADLDGIHLRRCAFTKSLLDLSHLEGSRVEDCSFTQCRIIRVAWDGARVAGTAFDGSLMMDGRYERAHFSRCSFQGANLSRTHALPRFSERALAHDAIFEDCDFRAANLDGLKLKGARFVRCRFHGVVGQPLVDGPFLVEAPSMDAAGLVHDASADALYALWGR